MVYILGGARAEQNLELMVSWRVGPKIEARHPIITWAKKREKKIWIEKRPATTNRL